MALSTLIFDPTRRRVANEKRKNREKSIRVLAWKSVLDLSLSVSLSLTVSEKTFRGGLRAIRQRGNPSLAGTGRSPPIVGTLVDARARTLFRFMEVNVDGCLWTS